MGMVRRLRFGGFKPKLSFLVNPRKGDTSFQKVQLMNRGYEELSQEGGQADDGAQAGFYLAG
jgi:hypothetical protein